MHFLLCFYFHLSSVISQGPKLRAAEIKSKRFRRIERNLRVFGLSMDARVFLYAFFGFLRHHLRSVRAFHIQHKNIPLNGFVSFLEQIRSFLDHPSDTAPHVPMYHYSASLAEHYHTIEFRLRHRFCLDFVVFSRQKQKFEPKTTNISLFAVINKTSQCANIDSSACSLITKTPMNDNHKCFCRLLIDKTPHRIGN